MRVASALSIALWAVSSSGLRVSTYRTTSPKARCAAVASAEAEEPQVAGPPPAQARRATLKAELLRLAAACNRGFGATRADRERMATLFSALEGLSPTPEATTGISSGAIGPAPLDGCWRLVYTTASDVLSLDASPVAGVGPIYQLIEAPGDVTNIIDLYPRFETLLPRGSFTSALRLRVLTRAAARSATRVGLTFYAAKAEPRALLGNDVSAFLPPLGGPLPRLPGAIGTDPATSTSPSFFEVVYLDEQMLLIRQNSPGGVFAAVRVDAAELDASPV